MLYVRRCDQLDNTGALNGNNPLNASLWSFISLPSDVIVVSAAMEISSLYVFYRLQPSQLRNVILKIEFYTTEYILLSKFRIHPTKINN